MKTTPYSCSLDLDVIYPDESDRRDANACIVGQHIKFDVDNLQTYVPGEWQPVIYDAMLVAAAVEVCDLTRPRSKIDWARTFNLTIPVHEPERWNAPNVRHGLIRTLKMLTGDDWAITFRQTPHEQQGPSQATFDFPAHADVVLPYSDGLDSRAVAGIIASTGSDVVVRVRVGSKRIKKPRLGEPSKPFENIPFTTSRIASGNGESSARSRGFKFSLLAGLGAYLIGADRVVVPESGQGSIGPVLVNVGQIYFDRRTHPQFTSLMSEFLEALFGKRIKFEHPVIWNTKGETLAAFRRFEPDKPIWQGTRSCWQDARHATVKGEHRQCGVCAACMLRRTSLHAAGYEEPRSNYIWENLDASAFWDGAHSEYKNRNQAQQEYALAGVLHMDHFAALRNAERLDIIVERQALHLANHLGVDFDEAAKRIRRLVDAHAEEWSAFVRSLPASSFVRNWAESV